MNSFAGKILHVDLGSGKTAILSVPEEVYQAVLSGKGLEAWYLYNHIPAGADPLGPDNILAFACGALCGTGAFLTGRWTVACKSPLTGGWGDANCGGLFAPAVKQCGFDAIFFSGIAEKPVYLFCDGKTVELRDASKYWGMDAVETEKVLHEDLDPLCRKKPCIACIGPAGEKLSLIAGISNEGGRMAARSGVGAVMGSKRLKAVVLAGALPMRCADPDKVKTISKELGRKLLKMTLPSGLGVFIGFGGRMMGHLPYMPMDGSLTAYMFREWGTPANTPLAITSGDGPLKNWAGTPQDVRRMDVAYNPEHINKIETAKYHCYSCPLGCGGKLNIRGRKYVEFDETHKPEYETIEAFGPLLMNWSLDSIFQLNELLNRAGMDSISAGNTVAWAIECFENGILTKEQTDGLELKWGNTEAILKLVEKMIDREGFGDAVADGVKRASELFGGREYAMHIGGQEPGMHDARNDPQLGVHFVAEPAPGKHTVGMGIEYGAMSLSDICSWAPPAKLHPKKDDLEDTETLAWITKANACYTMLTDGAGGCYYGQMMGVHMWKLVEYLNAAEGWDYDGDHYMEIGERIQTLRQLFNIKQGIDPASVKLPKRMLGEPPLPSGPLKGVTLDKNRAQVSSHWRAFGWDGKTGVPLDETIERLGINRLTEVDAV
ncbi:MAG: aldehyde ferredoxin oxidoreductase family protein [Oscillospiraceae bacterium]|nr:aldehyde ferredoxin oxidoreductase family protein [Oscillospiraceae bacterium]